MQFITSITKMPEQWRDFWLMLIFLLAIWLLTSELDLFEWFYDYSRAHEDWDMDELILIVLFLPIPLTWFTLRRMREAQLQTKRLLEVERQLSHARKMDGLGTLAAGMAHQVNNQLQPVIGLSELVVMQSGSDDPHLRQLEMIRDAALRARGSLDTVLRISRRDTAQGGTTDIAQNMVDLVDMLQLGCPSDVSFRANVADNLPTPLLPWDDLEGVMMNLFSNALASLNGGQGVIGMDVMPGQAAGLSGLTIRLSDTGAGIPADTLERIFEPYYTSKPVGEGTGLGLWQVQELLRNAGGRIGVTSKLGQGSQFEVWVPASYLVARRYQQDKAVNAVNE
jgi:signal transduction histidine kinase